MRHLMWILTWVAVAIGGVLGAASVMMLTAARHPVSQGPDVIANGGNDKVMVTKPRQGNTGRSLIAGSASRHSALD